MTRENVGTEILRTLHRIHRQLADLRGRLERGPKQVLAAQRHVEHQEGELASVQEKAKSTRMSADSKQVQLQGGEDKIEELKLKLNMASSNREYQALKEQIAAQEMTNSILADEILEGLDKIDEFQTKVAEADKLAKSAREKLERISGEVEEQEPLIRGDLERLEGELRFCEADLPADVRESYNRVVRQHGEDALAVVENQFCGGCHQHVPLNVCAEIMLDHPMFCKTCGRMLYLPEGAAP